MKRTFVLFVTTALLCMASAVKAQTDSIVQIGAGIDSCEYLPTSAFYNYGMSQQIYSASEIGQAGTIYSIAFYGISQNFSRNLDVYLIHTNKTVFASDTDWSAVSASDLVFSGNITFIQDQWNTIQCSPPFVYNGTDNLLVVVDDNTNGWLDDHYFRVFDAPNQALVDYEDFTNPDPTALGGSGGTVLSKKNQIQLSFVPMPCPAPSSFTISGVGPTSVTLSWTENGSANAWDICLDGDTNGIFTVDTNPYTHTGLVPNTNYTVMIRANCGGADGVSAWVTKSFLTPTCDSPSEVYVSSVSQTSAMLEWTADGGATAWEICLNNDYGNTITVYTNPYELTGLTPNTHYIVEVRSICGDSNNLSFWTNASFTTISDCQVQSTAHWYGYAFNSRLANGELSNYDWEKEFVRFNMQDITDVTAVTDLNPQSLYTYAAAYANGFVWCITLEDGHLCRASIDDEAQTISDFEIVVPFFELGGILKAMAFNPVNGKMYYITTEHALKSFDPNQPDEFTYIGFFDYDLLALAINSSGEAYTIRGNSTGDLYRLDLGDASVTPIGSTGIPTLYQQCMAFDQYTGELFWTQYYNSATSPGLYLVDPATAAVQHLGRIGGGGCQFSGLFMVDTNLHVGVPSHLSGDFLLYPNPATDIVNVQCAMNDERVETVEVVDMYGRIVRTIVETRHGTSLRTARINVADLSSGLYFVRMTTATGQNTKPFIKQ